MAVMLAQIVTDADLAALDQAFDTLQLGVLTDRRHHTIGGRACGPGLRASGLPARSELRSRTIDARHEPDRSRWPPGGSPRRGRSAAAVTTTVTPDAAGAACTVAVDGVLDAFPTTEPPATTVDGASRSPTDLDDVDRTPSPTRPRPSTTTTAAPTSLAMSWPTSSAASRRRCRPPSRAGRRRHRAAAHGRARRTGPSAAPAPVALADGAARRTSRPSPDHGGGSSTATTRRGLTVVVLPGAATRRRPRRRTASTTTARPADAALRRRAHDRAMYARAGATAAARTTDIVTVVGEPAGDAGTVLLLAQIREPPTSPPSTPPSSRCVVRRR